MPADAAPIIEVSGRTYPVEVRYRPLGEDREDDDQDGDVDQVTGICRAVEELWTEPESGGPRDALVFLSGEREIRDTADALNDLRLSRTEIVPLFARLSAAEQHRVFTAHTGRRVVLSTNVAETSLTVPGIRYVVDPGTARISRYSRRTKVQRLPIEPISQASAATKTGAVNWKPQPAAMPAAPATGPAAPIRPSTIWNAPARIVAANVAKTGVRIVAASVVTTSAAGDPRTAATGAMTAPTAMDATTGAAAATSGATATVTATGGRRCWAWASMSPTSC